MGVDRNLRGGRALAVAVLVWAVMVVPTAASAQGRCGATALRPWCDTSRSPDERAALLDSALTPDERITLLAGDDLTGVAGLDPNDHTGRSPGVPRLGIPPVYYTDGPVGPRQGPATAVPSPLALAATWDPSLAYAHGAVVANEARDKGNDVVFGPTVNIMRTPLGGRTYEAYGEDPWLVSRMTVGWITGVQAQGVIANVKHLAANNQEGDAGAAANSSAPGQPLGPAPIEGNRLLVNANVDDRTLHEIYLPQFEAAVREAHVGTVMCAYNRLNSQYSCENHHLLSDILEHQFGFGGYVLADYGAAHNAGPSLNAGLDFEPFPGLAYGSVPVRAALASGQASPATVTEHVRRILRTLFAFGFFDREPFQNNDAQIDKPAHARTAQAIEESAITLLKNGGSLPLNARRLHSIAVIGKNATTFVTGGGSGNVKPFSFEAPLAAIAQRAGPGVHVSYDDAGDPARAASLARRADVVIVFAGDYYTEGADRRCLSLECPNFNGAQDALIEKVASANPNTVVVLESGGPDLTPWRDRVRALVQAWYPGEQGGGAIARMLFGDTDPGGRLPVTLPRQEADIPTAGDPQAYPGVGENENYKEGVFVGYRSYDQLHRQPAFPFGFGLSYTRFGFGDLRITSASAGGVTVSVAVSNAGARTGIAVPELYLGLASPGPEILQPPRQLKGFTKLTLAPGETRRVSFALTARSFSYWDTGRQEWRVAPGCYRVMVGPSSRDLPLSAMIAQGAANCGAGSRAGAGAQCASRRAFTIRLTRGLRFARVLVNGRRAIVRRRGGRLTARVDLFGSRDRVVRVRVAGHDAHGRLVRQVRIYHPCVPRRRSRRRA